MCRLDNVTTVVYKNADQSVRFCYIVVKMFLTQVLFHIFMAHKPQNDFLKSSQTPRKTLVGLSYWQKKLCFV